jgi:hypothetical protein
VSSCLLSRKVKVNKYKTIILPVAARVLRRIFGPKMDEVTGEWRKLHSGELHNFSSYPNIIRQI